jgi:hypothetical protein
MDRQEIDYQKDLEYFKDRFELLAKYKKDQTSDAVKKNLKARKENSGLKELALHYGNLHKKVTGEDGGNNHEWKAYASVSKSDGGIRTVINKFLTIVGKDVKKLLGIKSDIVSADNDKVELKDSDVISKVTFRLHPTFRQPNVEVTKAPFAISRIGWGTFNVGIIVEFHDYLGMEKVELDHHLSFDKDKSDSVKLIYVDAVKALKNRK